MEEKKHYIAVPITEELLKKARNKFGNYIPL